MAQYLDRAGLKVVLQHIKANYAKAADVNTANDKLANLGISDISGLSDALTASKLSVQVVEALPGTGERGNLYLVKASSEAENNSYVEYVWVDSASKFEKLGDTAVDLTGYIKGDDLKGFTVTLNGGTTEGTDKFSYTPTTEKSVDITAAKIGAATPDDVTSAINNAKPTVDAELSDTSENAVQNKAVKAAVDKKVDAEEGKGLSTNDYTADEKTKLAGIAEKATADEAIPVGASGDAAATAETDATASVYAMIAAYL